MGLSVNVFTQKIIKHRWLWVYITNVYHWVHMSVHHMSTSGIHRTPLTYKDRESGTMEPATWFLLEHLFWPCTHRHWHQEERHSSLSECSTVARPPKWPGWSRNGTQRCKSYDYLVMVLIYIKKTIWKEKQLQERWLHVAGEKKP